MATIKSITIKDIKNAKTMSEWERSIRDYIIEEISKLEGGKDVAEQLKKVKVLKNGWLKNTIKKWEWLNNKRKDLKRGRRENIYKQIKNGNKLNNTIQPYFDIIQYFQDTNGRESTKDKYISFYGPAMQEYLNIIANVARMGKINYVTNEEIKKYFKNGIFSGYKFYLKNLYNKCQKVTDDEIKNAVKKALELLDDFDEKCQKYFEQGDVINKLDSYICQGRYENIYKDMYMGFMNYCGTIQ